MSDIKIPDLAGGMKTVREVANMLAENHPCEDKKYCGHVHDIEAALEMAFKAGILKAAEIIHQGTGENGMLADLVKEIREEAEKLDG